MKGKLAIITGATSGLGYTFAQTLARLHCNLLITGRRVKRLQRIKEHLEKSYSIHVETVCVDFNDQKQFNLLLSKIDQLETIDMLVNNAGYGSRKDFFEDNYESQSQMLNVLVQASTQLIHNVVPKMKQKGQGTIINVSSLSAFLPAPLNFMYCSAKSFMVEFSECLHVGLADTDIKIQVLCPGFIRTAFHSRIGQEENTGWLQEKLLWMNPEDVVKSSLNSLKGRRVICIPGIVNQLIYRLAKHLPKSFCYWLTAQQARHYNHPEKMAA